MPQEAIPVAVPVARPAGPNRFESAAALLDKAAQSSNDPNVLYMLALAYKRQDKTNEARAKQT